MEANIMDSRGILRSEVLTVVDHHWWDHHGLVMLALCK